MQGRPLLALETDRGTTAGPELAAACAEDRSLAFAQSSDATGSDQAGDRDRLRDSERTNACNAGVMITAKGYAATHSYSRLKPIAFDRNDAEPNEVEIEVLFCGVCHSDIHQVKNEWGNTVYPSMPGHEIVGRVRSAGAAVTRHKVGDLVGVGCMMDSCHSCGPCRSGEEQYCEGPNSWLATYNGPMVPKAMAPTKENQYGRDNTYGGYSNVVVVREDFVLKIPAGLDPAKAAPILCAGVTTFSPMQYWKVGPGMHVGVVGLGGLGNLATKLAQALGAKVTVFTTKKEKIEEAAKLGATGVLESDKVAIEALKGSLDFILSTVPEKHDLNPFISCLKRNGTICVVGALEPLAPVNNMERAIHRKNVAGSLIGSIKGTQEVLDFCAKNDVTPDIQIIDIQDINDAYKKVEDGDARFRFVIDMKSLASEMH